MKKEEDNFKDIPSKDDAAKKMLEYYKSTADSYDTMHVNKDDEHYIALSIISSFIY